MKINDTWYSRRRINISNIFFIFITIILINACKGQVSESSAIFSKPKPTIRGISPSIIPQAGLKYDTNLVSQYIRSIFQDSRGNYWFGPAGYPVIQYDVKSLQYFSKAEFFNGNTSITKDTMTSVHAIAEDKKGNLWFGTDYGVIQYDGKRFKSYTEIKGLKNIHIGRHSILVDKAGMIWVGTMAGVYRYQSMADSFALFQLLPPIKVENIMEDKDGKIWFVAGGKGVYSYDPRLSGDKAIGLLSDIEGLGENYANGMAQDPDRNYWFTMKEGICKYDGKSYTKIRMNDGIGGTEIWGIFIEKSGIIWITARGATTRYDPSLSIHDPNAFKVFTPADGLNCCVQSMYQDREGTMWWGAGEGLYRFDGKKFYQVKKDGPW